MTAEELAALRMQLAGSVDSVERASLAMIDDTTVNGNVTRAVATLSVATIRLARLTDTLLAQAIIRQDTQEQP